MNEEELMKKYYELPHKLRNLATRVVSEVFQEHGQTKQEKAKVLLEALKFVGFENISIVAGIFIVPICKEAEADRFVRKLGECWPLGRFECEVAAIAGVLERFKFIEEWETKIV